MAILSTATAGALIGGGTTKGDSVTVQIKILSPVRISGKAYEIGDTTDVDGRDARIVVGSGAAKLVEPKTQQASRSKPEK